MRVLVDLLLNDLILLCDHHPQRFHGSQVNVIDGPMIPEHCDVLYRVLSLLVRSGDELGIFFEPIPNELLVGLCNNKMVLIAIHHLPVGVGLLVVCLVEIDSEARPVRRQHFRQLSVAIGDTLQGFLCDVDNPLDSLCLDGE